ncbi:hypothetical protein L950_0210245 [Sphingobacterium sp. IITKGP-BTPF85]|nr:hypothetical protein L950_0210245 [Sphingobacterium sp. IITKGP-BTPF85]
MGGIGGKPFFLPMIKYAPNPIIKIGNIIPPKSVCMILLARNARPTAIKMIEDFFEN